MPSPKQEMTSTQHGHSMDVDASTILAVVPVSPALTPAALPTLAVLISHSAFAGPSEPAAPLTSAADIMRSHHNEMTWHIDGWLSRAVIYHPHRCMTCNSYVAHVVEANHLNHLQLSTESVELALHTAWPRLLQDIKHNAAWGPRHGYKDLQEHNGHLQEQVTALQTSLEREKHHVARLMDELKNK
jgi:hypothetical protein